MQPGLSGLRWYAAAVAAFPAIAATPCAADEPVTYAEVAPIFLQPCVRCYIDGGLMGAPPEGLRLGSYADALSSTVCARVVAGRPAASELVRRIQGRSLPRMPFDGPQWLSDDEIALIKRWVKDGARDADGGIAPVPAGATVRLGGTLTARWALDGEPVRVDTRTRLERAPAIGDPVEVRGRLQPDGSIHAGRIRRR